MSCGYVLVYLDVVDVKDEDAAVGTTVKRDTERLEALLTGSIPNLHEKSGGRGKGTAVFSSGR